MSMSLYSWKSDFFNNRFRLFLNQELIGSVKPENSISSNVFGNLRSSRYSFKSTSVFDRDVNIFDGNNQIVGIINYSTWTSKAQIQFEERKLYWKPINFFYTKWVLEDEKGVVVSLNNDFQGGNMLSRDNDEFASFLALFLKYNYNRYSMFTIIFILFWIVIFTNN